jgi:putative mycofactocin binding protein MftB
VCTEPADNKTNYQPNDSDYALAPSVRVRTETFGLLFYHTGESRLTFVKSGDLLRIITLPHGAKRIAAASNRETRARAKKLLDHLLKKRLICEP